MTAWRNSASLILAARHGHKYSRTGSTVIYNYKLLCLKRNQKTGFMPGAYVFPGGVAETSDSDLKWCELFKTCGFDKDTFMSLVPKTTERPLIFKSEPNELPREVSLRITAIRETFEECGVLMCKRKNDSRAIPNWAQYISLPKNELQMWQDKVHNDSTEFYNLCETLECCPDLWTLYEWGNWLTPTSLHENRRFDVVFFLACMPFIPRAEYESIEMEDLKWETPGNFLSIATEIMLLPPQQYEIKKIAEFENIDRLLDFAVEHNKVGVQMILPVNVALQDGMMLVLPGDSMYPKEFSLIEKQIIDKSNITMNEFNEMSPKKNRIAFINSKIKLIQENNVKSIEDSVSQKNMPVESQIKNKL